MALNPFGRKDPASGTGTEAQTIIETARAAAGIGQRAPRRPRPRPPRRPARRARRPLRGMRGNQRRPARLSGPRSEPVRAAARRGERAAGPARADGQVGPPRPPRRGRRGHRTRADPGPLRPACCRPWARAAAIAGATLPPAPREHAAPAAGPRRAVAEERRPRRRPGRPGRRRSPPPSGAVHAINAASGAFADAADQLGRRALAMNGDPSGRCAPPTACCSMPSAPPLPGQCAVRRRDSNPRPPRRRSPARPNSCASDWADSSASPAAAPSTTASRALGSAAGADPRGHRAHRRRRPGR